MTIKEWFADNIEQIVQIAGTFKEVKDISYNSAKMNIQIILKSGSKISLESYKISKNKEFGLDVFYGEKETYVQHLFIEQVLLSDKLPSELNQQL